MERGPVAQFAARPRRDKIRLLRKAIQSRSIERLENRILLAVQVYNFQPINIGAGGFVDGIFYDPHNQNTIYARSDVGGLYKTVNDGTTWAQQLSFVGGNTTSSGNGTQFQEYGILSFAIDPQNSNNLYADVGEYSGTNGNVLYSTNAGATWSQTPLSFYVGGNSNGRGAGERIAVDPYDSNIVLLGSNDSGLWESTNAGHSFSQVASFSTSASINLVIFKPNGGTTGMPTQQIFVGENSTAGGTNLFQTANGGTSWTEVTGTGSLPNAWLPNRAVMASDGNLYLAYADSQAPNEPDNGGIFRFNTATGVWANVSPVIPQVTNSQYDTFGYCGIALDPNSSTTLVVTSLDRYNYDDSIWRTTNANASAPTWTTLYDDILYQSYNPTRNTTASPWAAAISDGIDNWACTVAINPYNSAQIMYGTGAGIFATNYGTSTSTLTAPNSWYFPDTGIQMTAVIGIVGTTSGIPLYVGMGDVGGFAFTTLAFSPQQGAFPYASNEVSVDYAALAPNDVVLVGAGGTTHGIYSTDGVDFTAFSSNPGSSNSDENGSVAMSANGSTIVWAPSGQGAYYSTNNGASWTLATLGASGTLPTGGTLVSDKVNPNYFYYWTENNTDNSWTLYVSSNGGHSFTESAGGSLATGNATLVVNPYVAGQLWVSSYIGNYESTNFGASFNHIGSYNLSVNQGGLALGAPAPGQTAPSIYIEGILSSGGFQGIYRSDDGGYTWLLVNDVNHQYGGGGELAADPNVFGRVYVSDYFGNPQTSLPANWVDTDINEPGNPGWATSSETLSTGTTVNEWNVVGGGVNTGAGSIAISSLTVSGDVATAVSTVANGFQVGQTVTISGASNSVYDGTFVITGLSNTTAGLAADIGAATEFTFALNTGNGFTSGTIKATLADQFNFAYEPILGNASVSARLLGLTNADNGAGTPQAGVMFRASTNPTDPFIELAQTSAGSLVLEYRTTTGGAVTTQTVGSASVGSEYVELVRGGSNFTLYDGADGSNWTQLGSPVAITAMPATANVGLAASASYNPQLTDATFANVNVMVGQGPVVATPAAATPSPVTAGTSTALSVLGADSGGESSLTYTWAATGPASVAYTGTANGTNAAKNITANFTVAGAYTFVVTITDAGALTTTSTIPDLVVQQTPTTLSVSPGSSAAAPGGTRKYSATVFDQFGNAIASPAVSWGVSGTGNSISASGLVTLGSTIGQFTVTATDGAASNTAKVIDDITPTVTSFGINDGNVQRAMIDSLTLVFSKPVSLASGALALNKRSTTGGAPTAMTFTQSSPDGGTTWVLSFTDPSYIGSSLPDGTFDLTVTSADVTDSLGAAMSVANPVYSFYRLYGDFNGDGVANGSDFALFASTFGTSVGTNATNGNWFFDYYGLGVVNGSDFSQFAVRFGRTANFTPQVLIVSNTSSLATKSSASTVSTAIGTPRRHNRNSRRHYR